MGAPFFEAMAIRQDGPTRYMAHLDECWALRPFAQGGIVTAVAVRAMEDALGHPEQGPRTLHTTYAGPVRHGPLEIDVDILRRGRTMSQVRAEVRNPDTAHGHLTTCIFGSERRGFDVAGLQPPAGFPGPEASRGFRHPPDDFAWEGGPIPFWDEVVEDRMAVGSMPWDEAPKPRSDLLIWYRFDEPPYRDDGRLDPLSLIVLADTMPGAVGEAVGPTDQPWFAPSVDLTVHLLGEARSSWVLAHNRAHWAGDGYASADQSLWDCGPDGTDRPRLLAYATQLFLFTFPDGG